MRPDDAGTRTCNAYLAAARKLLDCPRSSRVDAALSAAVTWAAQNARAKGPAASTGECDRGLRAVTRLADTCRR